MNLKFTKKLKTKSGFTLLEMLLVIAMIAILAGIVIVAINPGRQLAQARNVQRASDLRAINSAVMQYYIDNRVWPSDLQTATTLTEICDTGTLENPQTEVDCTGLIDLSMLVPTYLSAIPSDPQGSIVSILFINTANAQTTTGTGYKIVIKEKSQTPSLVAVNSLEYGLDLAGIGIMNNTNTCGDPLIDTRDLQAYNTVKIGDQCWLQENLNIGTMLCSSNPGGADCTTNQDISEVNIDKYCLYNLESNCDIYGGLYQWSQVMAGSTSPGAQGICPTGWHIPTDTEWKTLEINLGMTPSDADLSGVWRNSSDVGSKLSTLTLNGTNSSGFTGLLAGLRTNAGLFTYYPLTGTFFWTSDSYDSIQAWRRDLNSMSSGVYRDTYNNNGGLSIRCLKNL